MLGFCLVSLLSFSFRASAQDNGASSIDLSVGADVVSNYVWRGLHCASASVQPSLGVSFKGLSLSAWGSTDFDTQLNEFDLLLSYSIGGLSVGATDYFFPRYAVGAVADQSRGHYFEWDNDRTGHQLEGSVSFDFASLTKAFPLSISWNTVFFGADKKTDKPDRQRFSTYVELSCPVEYKDCTFSFAVGVSPWESQYQISDSFNVVNVSVKGSKDVRITPDFSLPLFAQVVVNPSSEDVFFIAGLSF